MPNIVEAELSYKIGGLCFKVSKQLGRFCRERQYADKFEQLLKEKGIKYEREFEIKKLNIDSPNGNKVDFLISGKVLVDFKAKTFITKEDYIQMQRYLKAANLELGLIVNFRGSFIKPKRILNPEFVISDHSDVNSSFSNR
ncbi:MAG: GxxExxY protein [Candidatus Doudnabacteria bacterium]|nr:GxxExxY protein [Candidatus Doudnabacteria bacterium]